MDNYEALLALHAGDPPDRERAKQWLFDTYYGPLVAALTAQLRFDDHHSATGAGLALQELCDKAAYVVPNLEGRRGQPWGWLLMRGKARAIDEQRRANRQLLHAPVGLSSEDRGGVDVAELPSPSDTMEAILTSEQSGVLKEFLFNFIPGLDEIDRHILLHDLVIDHGLLTAEEAQQFDDDYLSRAAPDQLYGREQLKKRRTRLHQRLRPLLERKGIQ